tara:strand:+ start:1415 stop:1627 length:213 start_codon:yes stop_codon:yes gene_type:complete
MPAPYTQLSPTATPGKRYSFTAKASLPVVMVIESDTIYIDQVRAGTVYIDQVLSKTVYVDQVRDDEVYRR